LPLFEALNAARCSGDLGKPFLAALIFAIVSGECLLPREAAPILALTSVDGDFPFAAELSFARCAADFALPLRAVEIPEHILAKT
jgi:hypothetical protein